jgi:hypothetical protein
MDVVSVVEAVLDDPKPVLLAQQNKARGELLAQLKADGVEYEERMPRLQEITWPRPLADLLEPAFQIYLAGHPWMADFELSPKSVVREIAEHAMTFSEYIGAYQLGRSEGSVLRYLSDAYRALRNTVPPDARTSEVEDVTEWLGELVRQVDSSLLDEWEQLSHPDSAGLTTAEVAFGSLDAGARPITANARAFRTLVRNALFRRVVLAAREDAAGLATLDPELGRDYFDAALDAYFDEHDEIPTGPDARGPQFFLVTETRLQTWQVRQIIADPAGHHDWAFTAEVDLAASDAEGEAVVRVQSFARLD